MSHRLESVQGILGSVHPGVLYPINAPSVPSGKFPVTWGVGTPQPACLHPQQAPGSALQMASASWT